MPRTLLISVFAFVIAPLSFAYWYAETQTDEAWRRTGCYPSEEIPGLARINFSNSDSGSVMIVPEADWSRIRFTDDKDHRHLNRGGHQMEVGNIPTTKIGMRNVLGSGVLFKMGGQHIAVWSIGRWDVDYYRSVPEDILDGYLSALPDIIGECLGDQ